MNEIPGTMLPLGIVHNNIRKRRQEIIKKIETARDRNELILYGYKGARGVELVPVPRNYSLNWVGGPGRERGDNPEHPGLRYYCDVTASTCLREDTPGSYLVSQSALTSEDWTQVQILEKDLNRLYDELNASEEGKSSASPPAVAAALASNFPSEGVAPASKRTAILKKTLVEYVQSIKKKGGAVPAADLLLLTIRDHFPEYLVTRDDVRAVHKDVFGDLPPGKRPKQAR